MGTPSLLAAQSGKVLDAVNNSAKLNYRRCEGYGLLADGSTPTGTSSWETTLSIATPASIMICPSGTVYEAAATLTGAPAAGGTWDNGDEEAATNYAHIVFDCSSGSAVITVVWAGASDKMTTAEIESSLGTAEFVRIGDIKVEQTGAAAETLTVDNEERSGFGDISVGFNGGLHTTEGSFNG